MRKIFFTATGMLLAITATAQQKEGTVTYVRTMQMPQVTNQDPLMPMLPKSRTDQFELVFGNNRSVWKHVEEENNDDINSNGMQIRMIAPGQNDVVYCDFTSARKTEQREMLERKFIVSDSIRPLNWTLSSETQVLLGHVCRKATAQRTGKRTQMRMEDGKMEKKEIEDTSAVVAWFTTDVPVPAGPEVPGQLPGLLLALDINNGRTTYKATGLSAKADVAALKEPTKGKKVTADEYTKETAKMMDDMQKNNEGSGHRIIRMN